MKLMLPFALLLVAGCATDPGRAHELTGRLVPAAVVTVERDGLYRVEAHEIRFQPAAAPSQPRRAGFVIDLVRGDGQARGFVEWAPAHGASVVYVASGLAKRRGEVGAAVTTLDVVLAPAHGDHGRRRRMSHPVTIGLHIVIDEATGNVTATRRL